MASSLSDILSTIQNGVIALNNLVTQFKKIIRSSPIWTGFHTFTAGILVNGSPHTGTFTGSGLAAYFWVNQTSAASSLTVPEIGGQFTLTSNVGLASSTTAYKIGLTSSVVGGAASASVYGANVITQGFAGAGGYLVTGIESDVNNVGADAITLGGATAAYGMVAVAAGNFKSTAAYWAANGGAGSWTYGFAASGTSVNTSTFYDTTTSINIMEGTNGHVRGINFFASTFSGGLGNAFISPNNNGFGSANAAGNATIPLLYLDASNISQYGDTTVVGHKFAGNPGNSTAFATITNSHATANDIILQLQGGTATAIDTQTLYCNFVNAANTIQRGQINANDAAGVGHVAYAIASDERLKKSLGLMDDALDRLSKIEVHRYQGRDYTGDEYQVGFFAQNLYQSFPWAVTPSDHEDYHTRPWQVDYGRVTPLLVSAIQQILTRIEALESEVKTLRAPLS